MSDTTGTSALRTARRGRRPRRVGNRLAALGAAVVAVAGLAACGGSGESSPNGVTTLTVTLWDSAEATGLPTSKAIISKFEASHPKIKINLKSIPFSDFEQKLLLQIRSGQSPDVIQTYGNYTADFAAAGALADLSEFDGIDAYKSQMPEAIAKTGVIDGKFVAAPWAVQPVGLWYNKKVLAAAGLDPNSPPTTIEDFVAALKTVKAKAPGVIPMGIDSTNRVFGLDVNWPWLKAFGATPIEDGKANADTDGMRNYLDFMQTLGRDGLTETNQKIGYFRPIAAQNKVAFIEDQSILESVIKATDTKLTDKQFNDTWGVTTLPVGSDGTAYSVPQDHQLAIMQASSHKDAAWTFVQWMTRSAAGDIHVLAKKSAFPAAKDLPSSAAKLLAGDPSLQVFQTKITPTIVTPPWGPKYAKGFDPIMVGVQQVMTSNRSPDSVTGEMQDSLETALR